LRVPLNAEEREDIQGDIPYYGANGLQGYIDKFIFDEPLILVAEDGGYFDEYESRSIAYRIRGKSWVNNHAHVLRAKVGGAFAQDFIFYCLEHKNLMPFIKGGTRAKLNQAELREILIPNPPEPIQFRIAEILSTVDEAIEHTEALIAKYQQIKAGLMHDLFTRGVTRDGHLRPTRAQAPHLYKDSPLGWIPKEWEVSSCAAEFHIDSGITLGPHRRPAKTAHPYLRVANVFRDKVVLDKVALLEAFPGEVETLGLKTFDLLLVEGHANRNEIGRCSMVFNDAEGMLFQNHLFRLCATRIDPRYALLWLNSSHAQHYWDIHCATSSGLNTINRSKLGRMPICVPSDEEQHRIVSACFASREAEVMEARYLANLRQQKQGLMQDLLTGRMRVKVGEAGMPV
jgi:type I restriction enzyme S subunit